MTFVVSANHFTCYAWFLVNCAAHCTPAYTFLLLNSVFCSIALPWPGPRSLSGLRTICKHAAASQGQFVCWVKIVKARVKWATVKRCRRGQQQRQRQRHKGRAKVWADKGDKGCLARTFALFLDATPAEATAAAAAVGSIALANPPLQRVRTEILRKSFIMSPMAAF